MANKGHGKLVKIPVDVSMNNPPPSVSQVILVRMTRIIKRALEDGLIYKSTKKPYPNNSSFIPPTNPIKIMDEEVEAFKKRERAKL